MLRQRFSRQSLVKVWMLILGCSIIYSDSYMFETLYATFKNTNSFKLFWSSLIESVIGLATLKGLCVNSTTHSKSSESLSVVKWSSNTPRSHTTILACAEQRHTASTRTLVMFVSRTRTTLIPVWPSRLRGYIPFWWCVHVSGGRLLCIHS